MGIATTSTVELSPGQALFAEEHHAHLGMNTTEQEVYLYREDQWATYRWLVDRAGHTVEAETFRKSPREGIERCAPTRQPRIYLRDTR